MRSAAPARRLRQVLRRAAVLAVPMLLLGGLFLPAAVPAARAATCGTTNLALNQPAAASSTENATFPAPAAVDGNAGATVTNTGSRAGTDVAQLYVGDPAAGRTAGTRTVTVTATSASGATAVTTFVWTISPPSS
jgi:hypothetical protein